MSSMMTCNERLARKLRIQPTFWDYTPRVVKLAPIILRFTELQEANVNIVYVIHELGYHAKRIKEVY